MSDFRGKKTCGGVGGSGHKLRGVKVGSHILDLLESSG